MAVNLIGRECYMCINHPDKYPLAFILCFAFSNYSVDLLVFGLPFYFFKQTCIVPGTGEAIFHKSCPLVLSFSFIKLDFPPFLTFMIRV